MKKFSLAIILTLTLISWAGGADSESNSVSFWSVIFNILAFLMVLGCLYFSWKLFTFLKGGELGSTWQILSLAFLIFALVQIGEILLGFQQSPLAQTLAYVGKLLFLGITFWGLYRAKKVLS